MTGMDTVSMIESIMSGSDMRETPPCARMSAGTRSSAITATAPASSAIRACSAVTTSMITPPLSISAIPRLTRAVPWTGVSTFSTLCNASLSGAGRRVACLHSRSAEDAAQALQRLAQLAGHDPHLVRVPAGDLGEHLQVLIGEQFRVRVALVDGLEHRGDRLGLALGAQDLRLGVTLGLQNRRGAFALGGQDRGLLEALRGQDRGPLLPVRAHLLLHRVLDRGRRVHRLQLDPVHPQAPTSGRLIEHPAQGCVDLVARGQGLLESEAAD